MVLHPIKDVDVCITYISDKPPKLPVREALLTLGTECVTNPRGTVILAAKVKTDERLKIYREKCEVKERRKNHFFPISCARRRRKERKKARTEERIRQMESISYDEYYNYRKKEMGGDDDDSYNNSNSAVPSSQSEQRSDSMALSGSIQSPVENIDEEYTNMQGRSVSLEENDLPGEPASSSTIVVFDSATSNEEYETHKEDKTVEISDSDLKEEEKSAKDAQEEAAVLTTNSKDSVPVSSVQSVVLVCSKPSTNDAPSTASAEKEVFDSMVQPPLDAIFGFFGSDDESDDNKHSSDTEETCSISSAGSGKAYSMDQLIDRGYWDTVAANAVQFRDSQQTNQKLDESNVLLGESGKETEVAANEQVTGDDNKVILGSGLNKTLALEGEIACIESSQKTDNASTEEPADSGGENSSQSDADELMEGATETSKSDTVSTHQNPRKGYYTRQGPSEKDKQTFMEKHGWMGIQAELSEAAQAELEDLKLRNIEKEEKRQKEKLKAEKLGVKALVPFWEKIISEEEKEKEAKIRKEKEARIRKAAKP